MKPARALPLAVAAALAAAPAAAQRPLLGGYFDASTGMEAGGGHGVMRAHRARTALHLGMTFRVDELPKDQLTVGVVAELEPAPTLGAELLYGRWVMPTLLVEAGTTAVIAPETLLGLTAGARFRVRLGPRFSLTFGPRTTFSFIGGDLPEGTVLFNILGVVGIHADL